MFLKISVLAAILLNSVNAASVSPQDTPKPGESSHYSTYRGKSDTYPANITKAAILPTKKGEAGPEDLLFQNLMSAEWAIYCFYQQGVESFNTASFVETGFPNTTYDRITEIRDNEAGHLTLFQDKISSFSVKPGACEYVFSSKDAASYLELGTFLEVSSMAFLTGLVLQAKLDTSKSALVAIAETESRHNTWSLIDIWKRNPFAGPSDTIFPYANEILQLTNAFIVPGSCPADNPAYPSPSQELPPLTPLSNITTLQPGSEIAFNFLYQKAQPRFQKEKEYYLVAFHGPMNTSAPYNVSASSATNPSDIEAHKGIVILVLVDTPGAPTMESVVAGPLILPQF
jgi:hypothetical protein